jgi:hypothetical protein
MLRTIARSGEGSFLAVLKTFGNRQPVGMLSFPQPGVTLALDFPNNGERTLRLFERLDVIVREVFIQPRMRACQGNSLKQVIRAWLNS